MNKSKQYGYDEVVDTLGDSIEIYRKINTPLEDGLQFTDILALYDAYPLAMEVFNDRNTFIRQFLDLTPDESVRVLDELSARTGTPRDKVEQIATQSFQMASRVYRLGSYVVEESKGIYADIQLIGGLSPAEEE
jgi:hypothetical protein